MRSAAIAGWSIIAIFFGGFGAWAVTAPLHGAVVATGFVRVEGNRKSIQHLDGGIVKQLNVKEGDRVNAGDVLIVLDDTQARAEYNVLSQQFLVLRASEERLKAGSQGAASLTLPEDLKAAGNEHPDVTGIWNGQIHQFESRLAALAGARSVIREKIAQLEAHRGRDHARGQTDGCRSRTGFAYCRGANCRRGHRQCSSGMGADVHLIAYKQRIIPVVRGKVVQVSADRLTEKRTENPYYVALVRLDENDLAEPPHVRLYPGMPATVMIQTVERTAWIIWSDRS